jgi:hypothetical protein
LTQSWSSRIPYAGWTGSSRPCRHERDEEGVALGVDLVAAVVGKRFAQDRLVIREGLAVLIT